EAALVELRLDPAAVGREAGLEHAVRQAVGVAERDAVLDGRGARVHEEELDVFEAIGSLGEPTVGNGERSAVGGQGLVAKAAVRRGRGGEQLAAGAGERLREGDPASRFAVDEAERERILRAA